MTTYDGARYHLPLAKLLGQAQNIPEVLTGYLKLLLIISIVIPSIHLWKPPPPGNNLKTSLSDTNNSNQTKLDGIKDAHV